MGYASPKIEAVGAEGDVTPATLAVAVYLLTVVVWDAIILVNYAVGINVALQVNVTLNDGGGGGDPPPPPQP